MLLSARVAVFVAVLAVGIPGMAYVTTIIPEVARVPVVRALLLADRARARDAAAGATYLCGRASSSLLALLVRGRSSRPCPASFVDRRARASG